MKRLPIPITVMDNKPPLHLDPQQRSDLAVKQLLESFFHILESYETCVLRDADIECLHDFRVAVRKSRSLLAQVPDVIPKKYLQGFKTGLAWIGAETTPQRDLDIMLFNFDSYRALLLPQQRDDLYPVYEALKSRRQEACQRSRRLLQSARYQRLKTQIGKYLAAPLPVKTTLGNAKRPIIETANERIWKCYKRVLKQGSAITDSSPADDLHILRKSCKKLRYLIEFFSSLYPAAKIKRLVTALKRLQEMLGEHQDLRVHHQFFIELRLQLRDLARLSPANDAALGQVASALELKQAQSHSRFREVFHDFTGHHRHKTFKQLFRP